MIFFLFFSFIVFQTFCFYDNILQPFVQYNDIIHIFIGKKIKQNAVFL